MLPEVLVAFVTRSGSTEEVAQAIAGIVCEAGFAAEAAPMINVKAIPEGKQVILGAALYAGHLPKEFHRFVVRFQRELSNVRPWIFVLGPTENNPKYFTAAEEQVRKQLAKYSWLRPADVRVLGGKFDPNNVKLPFPFNLAMKLPANPMRKMPASDIRDWEFIRTWARAIADRLNAAA